MVFQSDCDNIFLLAEYENLSFSMSLPRLDIVSLFNFSHAGGRIVLSHCSFNLFFLNES